MNTLLKLVLFFGGLIIGGIIVAKLLLKSWFPINKNEGDKVE